MPDRRFNLGGILKAKYDSHKLETQIRLESIYQELDTIYQSSLASPDYKYHNPYDSFPQWTVRQRVRYQAANSFPGLEILVIAMHSPSFLTAMETLDEFDWAALLQAIYSNRNSLRMFALMRHIPYAMNYDRSPFPRLIGPLPVYGISPSLFLQAWHPHEVYLNSSGDIARCENSGLNVISISESVYHEGCFLDYPRQETWPETWEYPRNPMHVAPMANGQFPICWKCKKGMGPTHPGPLQPYWVVLNEERCTCTQESIFQEPLAEIRQFPPIPGDPQGPDALNRGVRTLSRIWQGEILAEYVGDIFSKVGEDDVGDNVYLFDVWGPPEMVFNADIGAEVPQFGPAIGVLSAALRGNWTRFLNHASKGRHNVEFETQVVGYKLRILAIARRDISFGEELFG